MSDKQMLRLVLLAAAAGGAWWLWQQQRKPAAPSVPSRVRALPYPAAQPWKPGEALPEW